MIEMTCGKFKKRGAMVDIHGGGIDLCFPHHANEKCQSELRMGKEVWTRVFMHTVGFLPSSFFFERSEVNHLTRDFPSGTRDDEESKDEQILGRVFFFTIIERSE